MSQSINYRPDIDGLRAVAVLTVVFFHAGFSLFSGGFVGVDIFFVISGYLITSIITRQLQQNRFSFSEFWLRRVLRIMPAMYGMVLASLLVGWFLLIPADYANMGRAVRYQTLFAGNIYFWENLGYFDTAAHLRPMLHMWSLAVEEQFYLCLPLILWGLARFGARVMFGAVLLLALASFVACVITVKEDQTAAFYLLHFRAWELMIGSLLGMLPVMNVSTAQRSVAGGLGLLAIAYAVFMFDSDTLFPGVAGLLPTLGAAAVIWAGPDSLSGRFLSLKPMVATGLISYSLYLWHWPILVFANYYFADTVTTLMMFGFVLLSLLMAWLSWCYIETPFRQARLRHYRKRVFGGAFATILVFFAVGQMLRVHDGLPWRLSEDAARYEAAMHDSDEQKRCRSFSADKLKHEPPCELNPDKKDAAVQFISWGDSHAASLFPLYQQLAREHALRGLHASKLDCSPMLDVGWPYRKGCDAFNQAMIDYILQQNIPHVIMAGYWRRYVEGKDPDVSNISIETFAQRLRQTVDQLTAQGVEIWIVQQVPDQPFDAARLLTLQAIRGSVNKDMGVTLDSYQQSQQRYNRVFNELADNKQVHLINPASRICAMDDICRVEHNGYAIYRDVSHLSEYGALYVEPAFDDFVSALSPVDSRRAELH